MPRSPTCSARPVSAAALAGCLIAAWMGAAAAADADFRGKTINVTVGGDPGGYDTYARLLVRHWDRHIPGAPTFVIRNMPGAGGLRAANYIYEVAPKDGTAVGAGYGGIATAHLFGIQGVRFDPRRFLWIGSMNSDVGLVLAWATAPVKTIADAQSRELIVGGSGQTSANVVFPTVMNNVLGTKFKIVTGYKGGSDIALAMERGEIEGVGSVYYSSVITRNPSWLSEHKVNVLVQLSLRPHPKLPDVPVVVDLARTPDDRALLEMIFAPQEMSRPFMLPPGTPSPVADALRRGFDATMLDAEFLADAERQKIDINNPMSGQSINGLIDRLYGGSPEVVAKGAAVSAGESN